jgi:hypothetical protein
MHFVEHQGNVATAEAERMQEGATRRGRLLHYLPMRAPPLADGAPARVRQSLQRCGARGPVTRRCSSSRILVATEPGRALMTLSDTPVYVLRGLDVYGLADLRLLRPASDGSSCVAPCGSRRLP